VINGDFQALAFLLGAMGLAVAAIALVVAIEVARRSQEYLRKHAQEMSLMVSRRISEQDRHLSESLERMLGQIAEVERSNRSHLKEMKELSTTLDGRLATSEGLLTERFRDLDNKTAALEKVCATQNTQFVAMKRILKSLSEDIESMRMPANDTAPLATYESAQADGPSRAGPT